jgi:hypothetical protein
MISAPVKKIPDRPNSVFGSGIWTGDLLATREAEAEPSALALFDSTNPRQSRSPQSNINDFAISAATPTFADCYLRPPNDDNSVPGPGNCDAERINEKRILVDGVRELQSPQRRRQVAVDNPEGSGANGK